MARDFKVSATNWYELMVRLERLESRGLSGLTHEGIWNSLKGHHDRLLALERKAETSTDKVRNCPHPDENLGSGTTQAQGEFVWCGKCGARWAK